MGRLTYHRGAFDHSEEDITYGEYCVPLEFGGGAGAGEDEE